MALTAGYEAVREATRQYEARQSALIENLPSESTESRSLTCMFGAYARQDSSSERSSLLWPGSSVAAQERQGKVIKAALYGLQVFYSFFIM